MAFRIAFLNRWRAGSILAESSEHPQYPSEDSQIDSPSFAWRSRNGSGSGNGLFVITAATKYIDFDEGGAELTTTLTVGSYNGQTLATEVKTRLDAAGGTYTVTYAEATGKFTIARAAGNFTLRWQSGTNTANNAAGVLGFDKTADDTGADTYTANYARAHYPAEYIDIDLGSALEYDFIALLNHNISASATITVYGADDSAFSVNLVSDVISHNSTNIYAFLAAARTKRYVRIHVQDPTNSARYVQIGTLYLAKFWAPPAAPITGQERSRDDAVEPEETDERVVFGDDKVKPVYRRVQLVHLTESDVTTYLDTMFAAVGKIGAIVLIFNHSAPNSSSLLCRLVEMPAVANVAYDNWRADLSIVEVV